MDIYGSPFSIQAYDSNRLIVSDIPHVIICNQPVEFTIDASKAGEGQLEVAINDGLVPNQVKALQKSKFLFTFIPLSNDPHILSIKFNEHELPGKSIFLLKKIKLTIILIVGFPKKCQVISSDDITIHGLGLCQALLGAQTSFTIDTLHSGLSDLQVTIFSPTNESINPSTLLTSNGLHVDWTPHEIGIYTIHVTFHSNPIVGSPFRVKCYDPKNVIVIPPTSDSVVRKPTSFLGEFRD
jgi:filamin